MTTNRLVLQINPQPQIRSTKGDGVLFRIPEDCRKLQGGKPCVKFRKKGICDHILSEGGKKRKHRLERYNRYKVSVKAIADQLGFSLPIAGWSLYFHIQMPQSWKDSKKNIMLGQLHIGRPDIDNLEKGFYDSLSIVDETVAQLSGHGKFWTDQPGFIEVLLCQPIYNPYNVLFVDQQALKNVKKRSYTKRSDIKNKIFKGKTRTPKSKKDNIFLKEDIIK